MRLRILAALLALSPAAALFAQSNELGLFVNHSKFSADNATDPAIGLTSANITFGSKAGYGLSFTHFVSSGFAVQLSGQSVSGKAKVEVTQGGVTAAEAGGALDLRQYDAALHWYLNPGSSYKFYVGGGAAWIRSGKLSVAPDTTDSIPASTIPMANKVTWLADAGLDIGFSRECSLTLGAKYTHYTATLASTPDSLFPQLKLNPLTYAAGLRFKF